MIKIELKRAFLNKLFLLALGIGIAIMLYNIVFWVIPTYYEWQDIWAKYGSSKGVYPFSLYNTWIGGRGDTIQNVLYFYLIPIIACIPHASSLLTDYQSNFISQMVTRIDIKKYYFAKIISVFISAGTVVIVPLLLNLLLTACFFPTLIPEVTAGTFSILSTSMWSELFYRHPMIYVLLYLIIIFLFSGFFALSSILLMYIAPNKLLITIAPMVILLITDVLFQMMGDGIYQFSPLQIIKINQATAINAEIVFAEIIFLALFFIFFFSIRARKDEVF